MNKDQVKGRVKEAVGKAEQEVGKITKDSSTVAHGVVREAEGKAQKNVGDLKNKIAKAIDK